MTDIVVGVRLNADGSGLVGQLKLSRTEMDLLRQSEKGAADGARELSAATDQVAKSHARAAQGARQASAASADLTKNVGLQRAGWQGVGFQLQDVFASYASGTRLSVIFAQQSGQLASAIAMIAQSAEGSKGKLAGLASFLGGPWGIALGVGVSVVSALASAFLNTEDAANKAGSAADDFAKRQSDLANFIDKTTGKLAEQNKYLLSNALLLRQNKIDEQKSSVLSNSQRAFDVALSTRGSRFVAERQPNAPTYDLDVEAAITKAAGNQFVLADELNLLAKRRPELRPQIEEVNTLAAQSIVAARDVKRLREEMSFLSGDRAVAPGFTPKATRSKKDNSAAAAAREAEQLAQFSVRTAEAVARINDEYNTAPQDIDRARQATAQLEAISQQVTARLETGKNITEKQREALDKVKASAEALKPVIQASLVRPLTDMLESQQRQIDLGKLQVSGRQADAQALQLTWSLMDKLGAESEDQLATELKKRGVTGAQVQQLYDNLGVLRQQTREMQKQQAIQQAFLSGINDQRENVRLTLESLRKDGPKAFGDFFKRSLDVVDRLFSEVATEKLFGGLFRDLEDQVTGADKVSKAGEKMADAVKAATGQIVTMGNAAATVTAIMSGKQAPAQVNGSAGGLSIDIGGLRNLANGELGGLASGIVAGDQPAPDLGDFGSIVVTARRRQRGFAGGFESVFDDLKGGLKGVFTDIFGDRGIFSESLGKTLGRTFGNAALGGSAGSMVTGLLGIKGSGTGGMLGGAIGGALGDTFGKALGSFAGPLGSILGGTLGSVVGGLFKKSKYGTTTITGGEETDVATAGNNSARKKASVGLASSVQETLQGIADEFGGSIGSFRTSIGMYKDDYRVSTTGRTGKLKGKYSDVTNFGDDEAGAISFAVMDAITDGGITGISAAVQKALRSSSDLDKGIEEALKVRDVEKLLGGLGTQLRDQFKTFEDQAKDRLRIATQYGFDVVAIEKKNAEDRVKLVDQLLADRVGSLQSMLDDFKFGSLFEGSLADQRQALLAEIATARTAAEAGQDGAADKLATLSRQLVELSRDAYGTAGGEYASDRSNTINAAEAVIKVENDRIRAAQDAATQSTAELKNISSGVDETNKLLSKMVTEIQLFGKTVTIPNSNAFMANVERFNPS